MFRLSSQFFDRAGFARVITDIDEKKCLKSAIFSARTLKFSQLYQNFDFREIFNNTQCYKNKSSLKFIASGFLFAILKKEEEFRSQRESCLSFLMFKVNEPKGTKLHKQ
jgi:hypothetical protein